MTATKIEGKLLYGDWSLTELSFVPEQQKARETIFTIGNGYLSTRGSFEEGYPDSSATTMIHGVFDDVPILYTELANCPDWLSIGIVIEGDRFRLDQGQVLHYQRTLNVESGILKRVVHWRSPKGHSLAITLERFASFNQPHLAAVQLTVQSIDYEGQIEIEASLNGYTDNQGFNHWDILDQQASQEVVSLTAKTRSTNIELSMVAKIRCTGSTCQTSAFNVPGYPTTRQSCYLEIGRELTIEKIVSVYTSRDTNQPLTDAHTALMQWDSYKTLKTAHLQKWKEVWAQSDVVIDGDSRSQLAVRFNLFQLLICGPQSDSRVSIPAKTMSGFGYRGHVFWDTEIFIVPFFNFTQPNIARNLLTYRYRMLDGARRKAKHYGYKGAMFAWESAATGDEVTPRWAALTKPYAQDVRIWCRDLEVHISADIAYAIWNYWQSNGDDDWIRDYGAEIILDTANFWMSRVEHNSKTGAYDIRNVIGADEFHEHVANNAFTNRLTQWHLEKALIINTWLQDHYPDKAAQLHAQLDINEKVLSCWQDIIQHIQINYDHETHLIEQFEGFFELKDIDLQSYEPRTRSMQTILGIEGANEHQVLKQPDVLMLLYLMREAQEFPYSLETLRVNWDYYVPRTDLTYGSSLSPAIHAILACDLNKTDEAYHHFQQAAFVDLDDLRGNAHEGIHGASAGGVWQSTVFGFGGIKLTPAGPVAEPHLPGNWKRLSFKLHWQGEWHCFDIKQDQTLEGSQEARNILVDHHVETSPVRPINMASSTPFQLKGVIFDLDGVITDTAEYHYQAWQTLAEEEGLTFNRAMNESLRGIPRRESLLKILGDRKIPDDQLQAMMARKNDLYVQSLSNISPADLLPGSLEFLKAAKADNLKIALGSASKNARTVLDKLGITDYFDVIADGYSVERSKPAPDLFRFAADHLGTHPHETLVIEDASAGIEAARNANMWTIGLGPRDRVGQAHLTYPTLADVTWASALETLTRTAQTALTQGSASRIQAELTCS